MSIIGRYNFDLREEDPAEREERIAKFRAFEAEVLAKMMKAADTQIRSGLVPPSSNTHLDSVSSFKTFPESPVK